MLTVDLGRAIKGHQTRRDRVWIEGKMRLTEEMSEMRQAYGVEYMNELGRVFFCRYVGGIFLHRDAVLYVSDTLGM